MRLVKILLLISLIAVLLCACTNASNNSSKGTENPVVSENTPQNSADDLLNSFISSKDYEKYTTEYTETATKISDEYKLSYTISDLNNDGISEILIEAFDGTGFNNTWLFAVNNNTVSLVFEYYGFGTFRYSPSQNAVIVPPEFRPFIGASYNSFYTLNGNEFEHLFSVGEIDVEKYARWNDDGTTEITKDELSSYFTDATFFEWIEIYSE